MKIFLPLITIILLSGTSLMAQDEDSLAVEEAGEKVEQAIDEAIDFAQRKGEFGIKAGLNFSTFNNADVFNPDTRTGVNFGLYARYQWTTRISGKIELLYTNLGARSDQFDVARNISFKDYSINLDYLALPILGEFMVVDGLRLELGPYIGVLVTSQQSFKSIQESRSTDVPATVNPDSDQANFVDVGIILGATYQFPSGFGIGSRYQQGFGNALGNDFFGDVSGANSVISINLEQTF